MAGEGGVVRTGRVARNDEAIAAVVIDVLADAGLAQLTAAEVARRTGMSKRPVLVRYPTRSSLAVAAWTECGAALSKLLNDVVQTDDAERRLAAWNSLSSPSPEVRAAAELIVAAQFDEDLSSVIKDTLGMDLRKWINGTPEDKARAAYVIGTGLGLLWVSRYPVVRGLGFRRDLSRIDAAVRTPREPVELPDPPAPHLDTTEIQTGDSIRDALLRATCEVVGAVGFDAATTSRIAGEAGVSEGALFRRYPSKLALFLDATQHQQHVALRANDAFLAELEAAYSRGTAEAVTIKQFCRSDRAPLRTLMLEQLRISWHDADLLAATSGELDEFIDEYVRQRPNVAEADLRADAVIGIAVGTGMPVLAALHEAASTYPYDVVTIPLEDGELDAKSERLERN